MRIDKVMLRACLSTLAAIFIMFAFMLGVLCLVYPSTMMHITYDLGMDKASVRHAVRAYNRTDDVYYIAFATETAIGADENGYIETCGATFIDDDEFCAYAKKRDEDVKKPSGSYEQYVYGKVCLAQYRQGKKNDAKATALESLHDRFPANNAFVALSLTAIMENDAALIAELKKEMGKIEESVPQEDLGAYNDLLALFE